MARRGLGRGLGSLIPQAEQAPATPPSGAASAQPEADSRPAEIPVDAVEPSPWQPRQRFDDKSLRKLADSIQTQTLVQPIVVRPLSEGRYELIAGERRLRAVRLLGWTQIPAVVREASDREMRELALIENLQRDDLNPLETARAYQALLEELDLTHEQVAERLAVSRAQITNTLRLLELPEDVKSLVEEGKLSGGAARTLLRLPDALSQIRMARRVVGERLSVRDLEKRIAPAKAPAASTANAEKPKPEPHLRELERRLRDHLGTKVQVRENKGRGRIVVEFYSPEDVDRLLGRMGVPPEHV